MIEKNQSFLDRVYRDKDGRIVLAQWPNIPISAWLVSTILSMVLPLSNFRTGFNQLATVFLFTWAYLEIMQGANYFRRGLGLVVIGFIATGYFR